MKFLTAFAIAAMIFSTECLHEKRNLQATGST